MGTRHVYLSGEPQTLERALGFMTRLIGEHEHNARREAQALRAALEGIQWNPDHRGYELALDDQQGERLAASLTEALRNWGVEAECDVPRPITPAPGVRPMVDASTAHLRPGVDDVLLDALADTGYRHNGLPRVSRHSYGWTMFLSADYHEGEVEAMRAAGCSQGLLEAYQYAHRAGAYTLNFDQDAEQLPGVKVHEERVHDEPSMDMA